MRIHQLQVTYLMEHDRILLRLNTQSAEELRLWLTRRMVRNLFPHIIRITDGLISDQVADTHHDGVDHRALTQFKKQELLSKADFSTPFNNHAMMLPIGEAPLLATTLHITPREDSALQIVFEENIPGTTKTRSFEVTLGQDLLNGFLSLLTSALQDADWGISRDAGEHRKDSGDPGILATAELPRYLN